MKATCWLPLALCSPLLASPTVFWASDPVSPGDAVLVIGEDLTDARVEVVRLGDKPSKAPPDKPFSWHGKGAVAEVLDHHAQGLKFVLPDNAPPGVFAWRLSVANEAVVGRVNVPTLWWAQGDAGRAAIPGGELRLYGKNLAWPADSGRRSLIHLTGPRTHLLAAEGEPYALQARLPRDLPPGSYRARVHNGCGGPDGWSDPLDVEVTALEPWPDRQFNVLDYGADGGGQRDDTGAILAALAAAGEAGGGVVYLPRGRYQVTDTLVIPRHTVLRGEGREVCSLFWRDFAQPPEALVRGTNRFAIEELTLYASNHRHVIVGDLGRVEGAGDVHLRRVRVRADSYRGHLKPEEVDERFRASLKLSTGGGDTVRVGGANVSIIDCDLYGSGRSLYLSGAVGATVTGCDLYNGRWGWYCLEGCEALTFAHNRLRGADLMSTGGGIANYSTARSEHIYYAHNDLSFMHGWDREAMTTDAGGGSYYGGIAEVDGTRVTLAEDPAWGGRNWTGAGLFILAGRGAGQYRHLTAVDGRQVTIDQPWAVLPDDSSRACITMFHGHYLLIGNTFTDTGAMQFYGTSIECIVAGNIGTRMQGFRGLGLHYHGFQPSWFCQFLDNTITEGNYYHWSTADDARIDIFGARRQEYDGPLNLGTVVRGNTLENNAHIAIGGSCRDALVERNTVRHSAQGVFVSQQTAQVTLRRNRFADVAAEVVDEPALRRAAEERMQRFIGREEPVAAWSFEQQVRGAFPDSSGNHFDARVNGPVTCVDGGVRGRAASFDGTGYLLVSEPAVFNAPDLTVAFFVKPATLSGRRGFVTKRYAGTGAPFVIGHQGASVSFEATEDPGNKWTFNFAGPGVLKADTWQHIAVVIRRGQGVTIYVDGQPVAEKANAADRVATTEPLVIGREAWGGDPPKGDTPGFFIGLLDELSIWTRALSPAEIAALSRP